MGRYIVKKSDSVTVSQEGIVGGVISIAILLALIKGVAMTITGIKTLTTKLAKSIGQFKGKNEVKAQKALTKSESLTDTLERVSGQLKDATQVRATVTVSNGRLGGGDYKAIIRHAERDILSPLTAAINRTESTLREVYAKNDYLENDGDDLDIAEEMDGVCKKMTNLLVQIFKSHPFDQNGLSLSIVNGERTGNYMLRSRYEVISTTGDVRVGTGDEAARILILAGELLKLSLRVNEIPTSNYAQTETYWLWDVDDMLKDTVRDLIKLVEESLKV